ncbi:hypothetical protein MMC19_006345 [Ptychographa xylographoides]|nr:hypothetical protein [Ptychographa xylographoides]
MSCTFPILLLDGGLGTTLESAPYNVHFSAFTPLWSSHLLLTSPETLLSVHKEFVHAGCDVLLTATYQASFDGFAATKLDEEPTAQALDTEAPSPHPIRGRVEAGHYMRKAVSVAREAFGGCPGGKPHQLVALSLGAYGACMIPSQEYTGDYAPAALQTIHGLYEWHYERLTTFSTFPDTWEQVDLVAFETIPTLNEIYAVRQVLGVLENQGVVSRKMSWISCVFPNDDLRLPDGSSVPDVVEAMLTTGSSAFGKLWGIGINCTNLDKLDRLIQEFEDAVGELAKAETLEEWPWLVVYPDGANGSVYNTSTKVWEAKGESHNEKAWDQRVIDIVKQTKTRGRWSGLLVGGCCKTMPDDIARLRKNIDAL